MSVRWSISGDKDVIKELMKRADTAELYKARTEQAVKNIQAESGRKAPVDTGFLKSELEASHNRREDAGRDVISFEMIDGTEYTIRQNYEHQSKGGFLSDSVINEESDYYKDLKRIALTGKSP